MSRNCRLFVLFLSWPRSLQLIGSEFRYVRFPDTDWPEIAPTGVQLPRTARGPRSHRLLLLFLLLLLLQLILTSR